MHPTHTLIFAQGYSTKWHDNNCNNRLRLSASLSYYAMIAGRIM
jgi:hypothetical protein